MDRITQLAQALGAGAAALAWLSLAGWLFWTLPAASASMILLPATLLLILAILLAQPFLVAAFMGLAAVLVGLELRW